MNFKLKNKYLLTLCVIVLNTITFSGLKAQAKADDKTSAKAFVQRFYDRYSHLLKESGDIKNYYTVNFDKAINMKFKDDDIGFDFDPISNAQDDRRGFQAGNVKQVGNKFFVDVHDIERGKSQQQILSAERCVIVETVKVGSAWKIANLIYPARNNTEKQTDLLTLAAHHKKYGY